MIRQKLRDRGNRTREWWDLRRTLYRVDRTYRGNIRFALFGLLVAVAGIPVQAVLEASALALIGVAAAIAGFWRARSYFPELRISRPGYEAGTRNVRALQMRSAEREIPFSELEVGSDEAKVGFAISSAPEMTDGTFQRSTLFDDYLISVDEIIYDESPDMTHAYFDRRDDQKLRDQLRYVVTRVESNRDITTNDAKFGLQWDLRIPIEKPTVYRVGYYDSLATNEAFRGELIEWNARSDPKEQFIRSVARFDRYFPVVQRANCRFILQPLSAASVANHVGVTMLALSRDGFPLFFQQASKMAVGANSIVVSASGSVNYSDLRKAEADSDLIAAVKYGMAREYCEEVERRCGKNLKAKVSAWLQTPCATRIERVRKAMLVTGFFRWVDRCGKPEFLGVARLDEPMSEIGPDQYEVTEFFESDCVPIVERLGDFRKLMNLARQRKWNMGLSSYMCLARLCEIAGYEEKGDAASRDERAALARVRSVLGV